MLTRRSRVPAGPILCRSSPQGVQEGHPEIHHRLYIQQRISRDLCLRHAGPRRYLHQLHSNWTHPSNARVKTIKIFAFAMLGHQSPFPLTGSTSSSVKEDVEFGAQFTMKAEKLVRGGQIKPITAEIRHRGFQDIASGLEDLMAMRVGSRRLVYRI